MSETTTTASAPAESAPSTTSASAPAAEPAAASAPASASSEASDAELAAALDSEGGEGGSGEPTVTIGGVEIPVSALAELPDDVLGSITRKVKVSGEEREVTLAEALQAVSLAGGAQDKMREAAQLRKQAEAALSNVLEDPIAAVEKIAEMRGVSREQAREIVFKRVADLIEYESMDPQERARLDHQREVERKAKAWEEMQQRQAEERERALHQQNTEQMGAMLGSALSEAGLDGGDAYAMRRAASIVEGLIAAEGNVPEHQIRSAMQRAAAIVRDEIQAERRRVFEVDDDSALLEAIGQEQARRIARAYAARVKKQAPKPAGSAPKPSNGQRRRPMSFDDLRAELEQRDREGRW